MRENKFGFLKLLLCVACVLLVAAAVLTAIMLDKADMLPVFFPKFTRQTEATQLPSDSTPEETTEETKGRKPGQTAADETRADPTKETAADETPTESTGGTASDETRNEPAKETVADEVVTPPTLPSDTPDPEVTLPVEKDPQTGEVGVVLPCRVPGYDLVIQKLAPYSGMYVEDGTNRAVEDVAMLLVSNEGDYPVEYAELAMEYEDRQLVFCISALPAGERMVVQEKSGQAVPEAQPSGCKALIVQRAQMGMAAEQVAVTENGDGTLTVRNLTGKMLPSVRIFYKYYMKDEDIFVGGIAFTVRITRLGGGGETTIQPSHYTSDSSRIVMVSTYEE